MQYLKGQKPRPVGAENPVTSRDVGRDRRRGRTAGRADRAVAGKIAAREERVRAQAAGQVAATQTAAEQGEGEPHAPGDGGEGVSGTAQGTGVLLAAGCDRIWGGAEVEPGEQPGRRGGAVSRGLR